jgi:transcriptional regulator with XRE-family HTH domain
MVRQREHRGWSQVDLAKAAKYSKAQIGAIETYERAPTEAFADALDTAFELPGTFARLYVAVRGTAFPAAFGEFATYEAQAVTLLVFEHAYAPGLLQTEGYAHAVLSHHHNVTADQVAERVAARMARQAVLTREDPAPPVLWVLIDELALHREIGSPDVMRDQLSHLVDVAALPHVTVQVIPRTAGAHPGLDGTFYLAELRDSPTILFASDIRDGTITDEPATVAEVMNRWRYLSSLALPARASLDLIQERQETWTTTATTRGASRLTAVPTAGDVSR